jgi:hypothetical protein
MKGMASLQGSRWIPSVPRSATASKWALLIGSQRKPCNGTWRSSSGKSTCSRPIESLIAISHSDAWLTNASASGACTRSTTGCCALATGSSRLLAR